MSKAEKTPCLFAGCGVPTRGSRGFCLDHHQIAYPCSIDGCANRVAAHSKSRCCKAHRNEAVMMMRKGVRPW